MAIFPMENKGAVENMRESKLKPLTAAEKKSAEENHNIIYAFLKQYGYSIEEHYNIAVFGYLKGIQAYHRQKETKYDLFFMCWQHMRAEMGNHFRMENTMKRKPIETVLSLDAECSEMENLYNCVGGKSLEMEIMEQEELLELLENLSEIQRKIAEMKMDGYKSKEIYVVLDLKPATYFRELKQIKEVLESLID